MQRHNFAHKGLYSQSYGFSSHVQMWGLSWVLKKWCFWTAVLEKSLESPLDCKKIKPINPKGSQPRIFMVLCMMSKLIELYSLNMYSLVYFTETSMAPHSSTLAWKIPWTEEPGGLQSMGLLTVGDNWANSLSLFTFIHWRRKWQPTPVFLPGESQGQGSLVGCRLWGLTESDTPEVT